MCGIVGYIGDQQAAPILLAGLAKLEYRGYDSAGISVRNETNGEIEVVKAKGRLKTLIEKTDEGHSVYGSCGIGHTRWATHGEPSETNAHPHCSEGKNVVLVHNGIIENFQELKEKLVKRGYTFYSETDTEVAVKLIDYYYKKTIDLVTEVSLPTSSGFTKYTDNMGEILNEGVELDLNVRAYSNKDWEVIVFGNLAHNKNKILKISESLKQYNERIDEYFQDYYSTSGRPSEDSKYAKPFMKYEEGSSLTAIYGMKSMGINPANGQEVYVKRDGTLTYTWESNEQQKIGDTEPKIQGAFGLNVRYRNFTLYTTFLYEYGGDEYNSTLVNNVENANLIKYNADKRVSSDRWQNVGDVVPLKDIKDRLYVTRATSRFVQKNNNVVFNSLSVGYDVDPIWLRKIHLSSLRLQFNMKDIATMSTIKREMGLNYPFARTFTFTLNASF